MNQAMTTQDKKVAVWNAAMGVTIRINHILNNTYRFSKSLDAYSWYHELKAFQREIYSKLDDDAREESSNKLQTLKNKVNTHYRKNKSNLPPDIYNDLDDCEKYLRDEADAAGLLNPNKKTVADMMRMI